MTFKEKEKLAEEIIKSLYAQNEHFAKGYIISMIAAMPDAMLKSHHEYLTAHYVDQMDIT